MTLAQDFLDLHRPGAPLLLPNPWDAGSAKLLASLGFRALATTSSGFAATLGRPVNVLAFKGAPSVGELAEAGVSRVSVGGAFSYVAMAAVADAAAELRDHGTYGYLKSAAAGRQVADQAF